MKTAYAHAYLLEGAQGSARTEAVRAFVRGLLCPRTDAHGVACGTCPSCRRVSSGTHEDVVYMERSGKESYTVKDAAALMHRLSMHPYGLRNVGVVDEAERLSETVQNKLLKTLEEPYPGTVILLVTDNRERLLPTIRSRCVLRRLTAASGRAEELQAAAKLLQLWGSDCAFYELRAQIDKKLESREEALAFLTALEQQQRDSLLARQEDAAGRAHALRQIEETERARRDILRGMAYRPALKRLCLEQRSASGALDKGEAKDRYGIDGTQ